jgi:hypothetical protein
MTPYYCHAQGEETALAIVLNALDQKDAALQMWRRMEKHGFGRARRIIAVPDMPDIFIPVFGNASNSQTLKDWNTKSIIGLYVVAFQSDHLYDIEGTVL